MKDTLETLAERKAHRLAGNTVQFSISQDNLSPIFIDTGIFVGQNALLQYDEAKDILHGISLKTGMYLSKIISLVC